MAGGGHNVWHEGAGDKADVDGRVGEEDEPAIARAGLELGAGLGAAYGTGRVLATNTDTDTDVGLRMLIIFSLNQGFLSELWPLEALPCSGRQAATQTTQVAPTTIVARHKLPQRQKKNRDFH